MCLGSSSSSSSSLFTEKTGIGFPGHEAIDGGAIFNPNRSSSNLSKVCIVLPVYRKHVQPMPQDTRATCTSQAPVVYEKCEVRADVFYQTRGLGIDVHGLLHERPLSVKTWSPS